MNATINRDNQQYVIPHGEGHFSTLGFDHAFRETQLLAERLGRPDLVPFEAERGTLSVLDKRNKLLGLAASSDTLGTWFAPETPVAIQKLVNRLIHSNEKVRIFHGDRTTGRSWMEEFDVIGRVGRSTGTLKIPLLVSEEDNYGRSLLEASIIRVIRCSDGKNLYRHPGFHVPPMQVVENEHPQYAASVLVEGVVEARFKSYAKACHWVAFMTGETVTQPV